MSILALLYSQVTNVSPVNFDTYQETCAVSTAITLSTFEPGKATHDQRHAIDAAYNKFGFNSMPILSGAGVFGSDDIVAIDQVALDVSRSSFVESAICDA